VETSKAIGYEYRPPADVPFSKAREELNYVLANHPGNKAAREMKITSLLALSRATVNMPTFNYYRIHAAFEKGKLGKS
jgi:hypothetical protein